MVIYISSLEFQPMSHQSPVILPSVVLYSFLPDTFHHGVPQLDDFSSLLCPFSKHMLIEFPSCLDSQKQRENDHSPGNKFVFVTEPKQVVLLKSGIRLCHCIHSQLKKISLMAVGIMIKVFIYCFVMIKQNKTNPAEFSSMCQQQGIFHIGILAATWIF